MEKQYLDLIQDVLENGEDGGDRTGTGTRAVFGRQIRCDLQRGFPLLTTKKVFWKPIIGELLWFLKGDRSNAELAKITFGDESRNTIWTANADDPGKEGSPNAWLTNPHRIGNGDVGRVYGLQWRSWKSYKLLSSHDDVEHMNGAITHHNARVQVNEIDQIARIVDSLKNNPSDRRMILTAYNVGELDQMALPPCHMMAQFNVSPVSNKLSCQVYIRSNDLFLGLPFNIASYAALTHMLASVSGREVGELIITIGNAHLYLNHLDQAREQLSRTPYALPGLSMKPADNIDSFTTDHFEIVGYNHHPSIKAPMAV